MGYKYLLLGATLVAFFLLMLAGIVNTSLWMAWHLLPNEKGGLRQVVATQEFYEVEVLPPMLELEEVINYGKFTRVISVYQGARGEKVLVLVPRVINQISLESRLRRDGWQTERIGLVVRAVSDRRIRVPSVGQAVFHTGRGLVVHRWPFGPFMAIDINNGSDGVQVGQLWMIGVKTGDNELRFLMSTEGVGKVGSLIEGGENWQVEGLTLAVPGYLIASLGESVTEVWNEKIRMGLGIKLTQPKILEYLGQFDGVFINIQGATMVIGARGAPEALARALTAWIQDEERYARPVKQAFRLPDGSLGFEKTPGEKVPVFGDEVDGCRQESVGQRGLWLCVSSDGAALGNDEFRIRSALDVDYTEVRIEIGSDIIDGLVQRCDSGEADGLWCGIEQVQLLENDGRSVLRVGLDR